MFDYKNYTLTTIILQKKKKKNYLNTISKQLYNYYKRAWLKIYYNYFQQFCFKLIFVANYLIIYYFKNIEFNINNCWMIFKHIIKIAKYTILLKGLGYKLFRKKYKFLKLRIGYSHFIFFKIPKKIKFFFCADARFKIKSLKFFFIFNFVKFFIAFRKPLRYKYQGIYIKNKLIKIFPGKIKKI